MKKADFRIAFANYFMDAMFLTLKSFCPVCAELKILIYRFGKSTYGYVYRISHLVFQVQTRKNEGTLRIILVSCQHSKGESLIEIKHSFVYID